MFLANTFVLPSTPPDGVVCPDVDPGSTHRAAIEAIAHAGVTLGYPDGTFWPGRR